MTNQRAEKRALRRQRVRRIVRGTETRPRLSVYRSLQHIYAQVISDVSGRTLMSASTQGQGVTQEIKSKHGVDAAKAVGKVIAEKCLAGGIQSVIFDRNGFLYHGRVKALADAAREAGLKF